MKIVRSTWASDVRALQDAFLALGANEVMPYRKMAELIGKAVSGSTSEYQTAKERLSRDHGIEIKTLPKVGAMRLDDGGIVEELPRDRNAITKKVRRSLRRVANVDDYGKLTNTQKLEHDRHLAHMGLMSHLQEPQVMKAIDGKVRTGETKIDVDRLIDVLRS